MDRRSVCTDQHLRDLLRAGRTASGNISQREAARRAGFKIAYWQKIESGTQPSAPAETLAAMFRAIGISAGQLRDDGYPEIADRLAELESAMRREVTAEEYLTGVPGASQEEINALQALWLALRRARRTSDPLDGLEPRRRPRRDGR